ncbi:MAG: sigma 54-interacting transcriptional regulator [Bdellovibrionota bacterium]
MTVYTLLHLDDDPLEHRALQRLIKSTQGDYLFEFFSALNHSTFEEHLVKNKHIDFVILDIFLAGESSGLNLIEKVKQLHPKATLLMSSNLDDPASVLESLKLGADEFLSKKLQTEDFVQRIISLREKSLIKKGYLNLQNKSEIKNIFVSGNMMKKIEQRIPNIIHSAIKFVYVEGESGTGKEVVADLFASHLKNKPFVKLNCAGIPKDLLESELFGHKKGSFTGAHFDKKGVIEAANGGWLFLDEVASLTPSAQSALLRSLENQEVTPIGETHPRKINVCFISASNISLAQMVTSGAFRNDLWQRLRETEILLTPLHKRADEIPELIEYFCKNMDGGPYHIEQTALNVLCRLPWREGNVRELRNCLRAMTENQNNKILSPMGIPERILSTYQINTQVVQSNHTCDSIQIPIKNSSGVALTLDEMITELLKSIVIHKNKNEGKINITKLSQELGISRSTLQAKLRNANF